MTSVRAGDTVHVAWTKWGGHPHWELDAYLLGEDEHGTWLYAPAGTLQSKPSHSFASSTDATILIDPSRPATPKFRRSEGAPSQMRFRAYVDMTTPPVWDDHTVTMVDLDLDVVLTVDDEVLVLDRDELALHRDLYGYPSEVVELAERSCDDVVAAFAEGREPYASVGWSWLP